MKNAIIFHGSGSTPSDYWYPWLKKELEKSGYPVSVPTLTNDDPAPLSVWLPLSLKEHYNNETILIGHSSGSPLILSILERLTAPVQKAILVAAFIRPLPANHGTNPILQDTYDWEKIRKNAGEITIVNSDNDPWGCDDKQGKLIAEETGGRLIIRHDGHMGSNYFHQPYTEFPDLLTIVLE